MTISNPDIVRVIKARLYDCRCHGLPVDPQGFKPCGGCEHDARCLWEIVELRRERDEANDRIRELFGNTEQLEETVARLKEDLRRMDL
jgi:hypothetical protein